MVRSRASRGFWGRLPVPLLILSAASFGLQGPPAHAAVSPTRTHRTKSADPGIGSLWLGYAWNGDLLQASVGGNILTDIPNTPTSGIASDGSVLYTGDRLGDIEERSLDGQTVLSSFNIPTVLPTQLANDLTWDSKRSVLWRIDAGDGTAVELDEINPTTQQLVNDYLLPNTDPTGVLTPMAGLGIAYDPGRDILYVSFCGQFDGSDCSQSSLGLIETVSPATGEVIALLFAADVPYFTAGLAYDPSTDSLWVGGDDVSGQGGVRNIALDGAVLSSFNAPLTSVDGLELVDTSTTPTCSTTPIDSSLLATLTAQLCQIVFSDEGLITKQEDDLLVSLGVFAQVVTSGPSAWTAPLSDAVPQSELDTLENAMDFLMDVQSDVDSEVADTAKEKIGSLFPCSVGALAKLNDANSDDQDALLQDQKATHALANTSGSTALDIAEIVYYQFQAAKDLVTKLHDLNDALDMFGDAPCFVAQGDYENFVAAINAAAEATVIDIGDLDDASINVQYVLQDGYSLVPNPGVNSGWTETVNPSLFPQTVAGHTIDAPVLSGALGLSSDARLVSGNTTSVHQGRSLAINGFGFQPSTSVMIVMNSVPIRLAVITSDIVGGFSATVTIPVQAVPGAHELEAVGQAPDGSSRVLGTEITVTGSTPPPQCIGTLGGSINRRLLVPAGGVCTLNNAIVQGKVRVGRGAVFEADSSTLERGIRATAPLALALCGDDIGGRVVVKPKALLEILGVEGSLCTPDSQ